MSFEEKFQYVALLKQRICSTRERLATALQAMDYTTALDCQIEVDDLEKELRGMTRKYGMHLIRQEVATEAPATSYPRAADVRAWRSTGTAMQEFNDG